MIVILIKIAASLALGVLAGFGAVYLFNKMQASGFTDYDAKPPAELSDPHIQRVKGFPWRWIYAAGFSCLLIRLSFYDVQFAAAGLFACWAMLIIGLADLKYMIIPDQFVIMLAISAFGFVPCHSSLMQPLLGALIGGGVMLMVGVLGGAAFKKEVLGFGDVKLFASLGLALGFLRNGRRSSAHRFSAASAQPSLSPAAVQKKTMQSRWVPTSAAWGSSISLSSGRFWGSPRNQPFQTHTNLIY